jgi:hypothetical protein
VTVLSPAVPLHHEAVTPRPEWLAAIATGLAGAPATSIHVYPPPLALMTYYDGDGGAATSWVR